LWESGETHVQPAQLAEVVDTLSGLASARLSSEERLHAVGSGSLLVRTRKGCSVHPRLGDGVAGRPRDRRRVRRRRGRARPAGGAAVDPAHRGLPVRPGRDTSLPVLAEAVLADAGADQTAGPTR